MEEQDIKKIYFQILDECYSAHNLRKKITKISKDIRKHEENIIKILNNFANDVTNVHSDLLKIVKVLNLESKVNLDNLEVSLSKVPNQFKQEILQRIISEIFGIIMDMGNQFVVPVEYSIIIKEEDIASSMAGPDDIVDNNTCVKKES